MDWRLLLLFTAPTLLTIAYAVAEQMGVVDRVFGRKAALEGLGNGVSGNGVRFTFRKSNAGLPRTWQIWPDI